MDEEPGPEGKYVMPSLEEFERGEDEVVHIPTGARIWADLPPEIWTSLS